MSMLSLEDVDAAMTIGNFVWWGLGGGECG